MEIKAKTRDEVEEKYKWNLDSYYKNNEEWQAHLHELEELYPALQKYKGHILDSADTLFELIKLNFLVNEQIEKLYVYAHLRLDEDLTNTTYADMMAQITSLNSKISEMQSYIDPEIVAGDQKVIESYINQNAKLEEYRFFLTELFHLKEHTLTSEKEELLSRFGDIVFHFQMASESVRNSEITYTPIVDEEGRTTELTPSNSDQYIKSTNREVRKRASESIGDAFDNSANSLAYMYAGHIKHVEMEAKLRGYKNALERNLYESHLDPKIYQILIDTANKHKNIFQKYLKIRKMVLQVDQLEHYDLAVPLVPFSSKTYTFEEAKTICLDAFKSYGKEYTDVLEKAFDLRWIDVYPNTNKRTGWYSWGAYGASPVILGNYTSKLYDVSAIAHELGHLVNSYLAMEKNPYQYQNGTHFEAEVASLTNEVLLSKYLLEHSTQKEEKLEALANVIGIFVDNFFGAERQAEFEEEVHTLAREGGTLTASIFSTLWEKTSDKYYGNLVKRKYKNGWARPYHLYVDFYFFKYATGITAAFYEAQKLLKGNPKDTEEYIAFLKVGGSKKPLDTLKVAGIDMTREEVFEESMQMFDELLDQFIEVYNQ